MLEMREQGKNLHDQINAEGIGKLPEKEFRVMIVKTTQNLWNRMEAQIVSIQETFNKDLEELKTNSEEQHNNWNEKYIGRNQ